MIKNPDLLQNFEDKLVQQEKADFLRNIRLVEAMYWEAVSLGIFPLKDALDGVETDIKIAEVINSVSNTP
ncbi:hypothetical protein ACFLQZ_04795 [Acidobacteriota bacterium]